MIAGRESNTYWAKAQLAQDTDLQTMMTVAMLDVCDEVGAEDPATLTPPTGFQPADAANRKQNWHNIRANLARDIMRSPGTYVVAFCGAVTNLAAFDPLAAASMKAACRKTFAAMCGVG